MQRSMFMVFEKTEVFNFEGALRGMRNPMNSWNRADSKEENGKFVIGEKDLDLAQRLIKAGGEHRKFLRQIFVSVDITAPMFWWSEFDTYKISTVSNSTSKMHKLASTPITRECFEHPESMSEEIINICESLRNDYNSEKDPESKKIIFETLVTNLPCGWLQKRTITMNYENVRNMIKQRKNHKLSEWRNDFISWTKTLPYAEELLFFEN